MYGCPMRKTPDSPDSPSGKSVNRERNSKEKGWKNATKDEEVVERIKKAKELYELYGKQLKQEFVEELGRLDRAIERTQRFMRVTGLPELCKECAEKGKCCCRPWVADLFDEYDLLLNCLLGVELPEEREVEGLCFFVGKKGCRLKVRQVICVDFLCPEAERLLGEKEIELREIEGEELELAFILKEKVKKKLEELTEAR